MHFRHLLLVLAVCLATGSVAVAAQKKGAASKKSDAVPKAAAADKDAASDDSAASTSAFSVKFREWKQLVAKLQRLRQQYNADPAADKKALEDEAKKTTQQAQDMLPKLIDAAEKSYVEAPNKDKELSDFLFRALIEYYKTDNHEKGANLAKILVENHFDNPQINLVAGLVFFGADDFDDAGKYLQLAKDAGATDQTAMRELSMIPQYKEMWERELKIRAAEEQANDLPRVNISTSKGDILIELFENEAPNATANFISLVEKGFYDGTPFHRVLPGFMAQGGDPKGDGTGGPGYTIPCECYQDNHRIHFRGSLSMAHAGKDTGGSQFFLTFVPTPHLDGKHTVFGRVIDGFDVLAKLQRTEPGAPGSPDKPDKIVKATVVRKRKHTYKPITRADKK
jgi:cyclophilin family peptidyl-prolyl cis-trans isomerase